MSSDLFQVGVSGLLAQSKNLLTTSNNIANINTPGYTRQRNDIFTQLQGGVGRVETVRITNEFARKMVLRDTSNASYDSTYLEQANVIDRLLSENANSLSTALSSFFNQLQESINNPTSESNRDLVLSELGGVVDRASTLSSLVLDQTQSINEQLKIYSEQANSLIEGIADLNKAIASKSNTGAGEEPLTLLDQREEKIRQLSELMGVNVVQSESGESLVYTQTGEALVMKGGAFNVFSTDGNPVNQLNQLKLKLTAPGGRELVMSPDNGRLGGKLGGLLAFRDEVLEPSQAKLGQIMIAMADSMNQQNRLGMDLDGEIGGDIFDFSAFEFSGYDYESNNGTGTLNYSINDGQAANVVEQDLRVELEATGNPNEYNVNIYLLNADGSYARKDAAGNPIASATQTTTLPDGAVDFGDDFGVTLDLSDAAANYADGDSFVLRPAKEATAKITLLDIRPEDLAYASPVRGEANSNNTGGGVIDGLLMTNTDPATSAINPTADGFDANAPGRFVIDAYDDTTGEYTIRVYQQDGTDLGTFVTDDLDNIVSQAVPGVIATDPGYDFNIGGRPNAGDEFTIGYNTNGFSDNKNGLALAQLQTDPTVRRSGTVAAGDGNGKSFTAAYSDLVSLVGQKTSRARVNAEASGNLLQQSTNWRESVSGVSRDEEAANLLQYQQAYAASAQIIASARTIFDTLLQAAR
ncbi:flagellar hook-associated protein FlgK [Idiomarina xiamenensis]|uniref:Flagellar hook-associated protein 1 n=1 Tax=Idiomarina xiamenensis 10-D-4 TaxID=740709 RepID=K2K631_9GAMM|nr:flagellar hook-associated protein FlgK [Idiomarina xiamenensis]EKE82052.1 flagellar hook-associated protein FlgK [Idiomarina xiamenensis 10-D-4]